MVCYIIPTVAAILHYLGRKNVESWKNSVYHHWLTLLLAGGALFGIVDHLWNGELLLISGNPFMDILLGITITLVIVASWFLMVTFDKMKLTSPLREKEI